MHNTRALHPADPRKAVAAMGNQRVDERPACIAGTGMNHQPCRLVDDDDVGILVEDPEGYGFGRRFCRFGWRNREHNRRSSYHACVRVIENRAVMGDASLLDQRLQPAPRKTFGVAREESIEALARGIGLDQECPLLYGFAHDDL